MKRSAERQITKDDGDGDDDEIEEIQDPQVSHKADEVALAKRQIRALPRRALATSKPPALNGSPLALASDPDNAETVPPPKFGGFSGFGAGTSPSSPFTFAADPLSSSAPQTQSTRQPFPGSDAPPPKFGTSLPQEETDAVAFKYFKSLRGLNTSFLSAISTAVDKDPFFDVASLVDSYKNLRTTIQSEFDGSSKPFTMPAPVVTNSTLGAKPSSEKTFLPFSMPKPSVGSTDSSFKPSTVDSGAKTSGFTFPPFVPPPASTPTQLPFGITPKPSESSTPSSATPPDPSRSAFKFPASSTTASTSSLQPASAFTLASSSTENTTVKTVSGPSVQGTQGSSANLSSQSTSTVPSFGSTSSTSNFFAAVKVTTVPATSDAAFKPTSVFGSSIFGSSNAIESGKPSPFSPSFSDNQESSKAPASLFGNPSSSSTSVSVFGSSDKPVSFFGSASPPKTGAFAFGKPGGSIGNPVGFGFGSSSPGTNDAPSSSGFNFSVPSTKPTESLFSPSVTDKSIESTPQPEGEGSEEGGEEDTTKLLPSQAHDDEGEGEEEEETMHVVRCKLYRLAKSDDKTEWKDLGIGMFRLKRHKETDVRRVLMRNSTTGRILVNFRIYAGLKPSVAKTIISFVGYENNTPTSFRIRVKTEEQAAGLKQAMEREVAVIQVSK